MGAAARIIDIEDPEFDPFLADEIIFGDTPDPYPKIQELLRQSPVHEIEYRSLFSKYANKALGRFKHYTILGYDTVSHVLTNPETFTNEAFRYSLGLSFGQSVSTMDAPEHPRYRRVFQKAFMPNVVSRWGEPVVEPVIDELIGAFEHRGSADLVAEFTLRYPTRIICRQLDLPPGDFDVFHKLAVAQTVYPNDIEHAVEAGKKLGDYFGALLEERRANPGEDIISALAAAEADGERLPDEIIISFLRQLMNAGGDTTYRATSVLLTALLTHTDQFDAVRADRALVPQAIEEALRWDGPVMETTRMAGRDVELAGVEIPQGAVLDVILGSANRDPSKYADPNRFDIFRDRSVRHIPFATGPHVCIGQHLARVEMTRALNAILDRLPNVRLDPDRPPPRILGFKGRAPRRLDVVFG